MNAIEVGACCHETRHNRVLDVVFRRPDDHITLWRVAAIRPRTAIQATVCEGCDQAVGRLGLAGAGRSGNDMRLAECQPTVPEPLGGFGFDGRGLAQCDDDLI